MSYLAAYGFRTAAFYVGLPVAGWLLSAEELGRFFYLLAIVNLASVAATLGLGSYITRRAYNAPSLDYLLVSTLAIITVLHGVVGLAILGVAPAWCLIAAVSWSRGCAIVSEIYLLAAGERRRLVTLNILHGASYLGLAVLLSSLSKTADAWLSAMAGADLLLVVSAVRRGASRWPWQSARATFRRHAGPWSRLMWHGVAYGAPILLASLANVGLNSLDRFVVKHFLGYSEVAVFSMMYTLAFAGNRFVVQPVNQVAAQAYMRQRASSTVQADIQRRSRLGFILITTFVAACTLGGNLALGVVGAEYRVDPENYLLVGLATLFAMGFALCSLPLKRRRSTVGFATRLVAAAVVNVAGSWVLVPRFGILGASIASYAAYAMLFLLARIGCRESIIDDVTLLACLLVGATLAAAIA